jgi:hypothetical protein
MPVEFWPLPQSSPGMVESIALRGGGLSLRKQRFSVQTRARAEGSVANLLATPALWLREMREGTGLHGAVALDAHRGCKEAQDGRGRAHRTEHLAASAAAGPVGLEEEPVEAL